jgi:hypothetical protein
VYYWYFVVYVLLDVFVGYCYCVIGAVGRYVVVFFVFDDVYCWYFVVGSSLSW